MFNLVNKDVTNLLGEKSPKLKGALSMVLFQMV